MSVDDAVDALSAVSAHLNLQLVTMLVAHGVNVQAFRQMDGAAPRQ